MLSRKPERNMDGVAGDFGAVFSRWRTWLLMGNQDISMRYRRSVIGPFWISITMAVLVLSIGTLYAEVQHQPYREFLTYFGCGILAWTFLSTLINEGCQIVMEADGHLRNVRMPTPMLSARMVYRNTIILFHNALVVGLMLAFLGQPFTLVAVWSIVGLALYIPLGLFLGVAFGPVCARFRDLTQVVGSIVQIGFFLTPIMWKPSSGMRNAIFVDANPFYHLIEIVRRPLLGALPTLTDWVYSLGMLSLAMVMAVVSAGISRKRIYLWL
jgi:ABC-type polysaccharide/polyol phosphate export permease